MLVCFRPSLQTAQQEASSVVALTCEASVISTEAQLQPTRKLEFRINSGLACDDNARRTSLVATAISGCLLALQPCLRQDHTLLYSGTMVALALRYITDLTARAGCHKWFSADFLAMARKSINAALSLDNITTLMVRTDGQGCTSWL